MNKAQAENKKENMLRRFYRWNVDQASKPGAKYFLSAFAFLESIILPIPTDPLLIAKATLEPKRALWVSSYVTFFSVLGGLAGYLLGAFFWEQLAPYFFQYIFSEEVFNVISSKIAENGFLFILLGAFTPLPFKAFCLVGGALHLNLVAFMLSALIGRGLRFYILGLLIYFFGPEIRNFIEKRLELIFSLLGLAVVLVFLYKLDLF